MDGRRKLAHEVLVGGLSLSEACRQAGVTRPTGRKWVRRAQELGIDCIAEQSRNPKHTASRTSPDLEAALLKLKDQYPHWGARKLVVILKRESGIALALRTAERVLSRHGRTVPNPARQAAPVRFERETCGALLQLDFKGLPKSLPYSLLSVLDDHGRYCLAFEPVPDKTGHSVKAAMWTVFGDHGLPESMLMDNGDCWGAAHSRIPTAFEVWLMLLRIRPIHGRIGHPQTQGKVERFHRTAKLELGDELIQPSLEQMRQVIIPFIHRYNWIRPHDALGGDVPGSRYAPFATKRPDKLPEHHIPQGALSRMVDAKGYFTFKGTEYKIGKGLIGHRVLIREDEFGMRTFFQDFPLLYLSEIRTTLAGRER
jgi:transposase InsO family protein